jgi:hypothetical protein
MALVKDKATKPEGEEKKFKVMLGNGINRYVITTPQGGVLYEAGVEYPVTAEQRDRLFQEVDDDGVRVFYDADVIKAQMRAQLKKRRAELAAAGDEEAQRQIAQESLEIDTGAMALRDSSGGAVGVVSE